VSAGDSKEEILATIRSALQGSACGRSPKPYGVSAERKLEGASADLIERFESEITRVGARFYRAASSEEVCAYVERVAAAEGARTILCSTLPDECDPRNQLAGKGFAVMTESGGRDFVLEAASADIGLTGVDYGLAETGSLVLLARAGQPRSISLLPPVHIALIKPQQIIRGFDELFFELNRDFEATGLKSAVTFITGPSRTADIELKLVVGVHGPQQLHAVLI
jgi:L-lactate dehydrogenase complex protein LldG